MVDTIDCENCMYYEFDEEAEGYICTVYIKTFLHATPQFVKIKIKKDYGDSNVPKRSSSTHFVLLYSESD